MAKPTMTEVEPSEAAPRKRPASRRRSALLLAGMAVGILTVGFMPWHLARTTLDARILSAIERLTGLEASATPGIHLALLPLPRVIVTQALLTHTKGDFSVAVPRLHAEIRILPLLGGHIELETLDLVSPQITFQGAHLPENMEGWSSSLKALLVRKQSTPRLVIRDGSFFLKDALSTVSTIRDINLVIAERDPDAAIIMAGTLRWRGDFAEINAEWPVASVAKPVAQKASFSIRSTPLNARFSGQKRAAARDDITGAIEIVTPDIGNALSLFGESNLLGLVAEKLHASGTLNWNGREVVASALTLILDGDRLNGALSLLPTPAGRWALSGTLAGSQLGLDRMLRRSDIGRYFMQDEKSRATLNLKAMNQRNIDLRLSLDSARLAQLRMTSLALQFMVANGKVDLNLVEATAHKATLRARLALSQATSDSAVEMKLTGNFERLDLAGAALDLGEPKRLSGTGFGQLTAQASGKSMQEAIENLKGRAAFSMRHGDIGGIALGDLARRAERQPLSALRDFRNGRTAFELANFSGNILHGVLELSEGQMAGPGYKLSLTGRMSLESRMMELGGILAGANNALQIPFTISGPWSDPLITPEADALIRRSGGAAPLFSIQ